MVFVCQFLFSFLSPISSWYGKNYTAYTSNGFFREKRSSVFFPFCDMQTTTFVSHITHIISVCSNPKMFWIATTGVVTRMANAIVSIAIQQFDVVMQHVSDSMSFLHVLCVMPVASYVKRAVSVSGLGTSPLMAACNRVYAEFCEKPFLVLCRHRQNRQSLHRFYSLGWFLNHTTNQPFIARGF